MLLINEFLSVNSNLEKKVWKRLKLWETKGIELNLDGTTKEEDFCECVYWQEHGYCKTLL